ncbi:ROK family protein [Oceanivirga salmonicida]|uniref:ROK family protein n=1 Tax=Oceanivirga salmonicida TaxID=1769291 RepID=UPI00082A5B66|nr:ROK family protein [Oceanivirga salmonicida]
MKYYGGIDLGGTNTKIGVLDENANIILKTSIKTSSEYGYEKTIKRICDTLKSELEKKDLSIKDLSCVGVGVPGPVIAKSKVKMFSNFPWPKELKVADEFRKLLEVPVYIDNDVNVITLGEVFVGAGKGYKDVIGVAIGTGIGAGVVNSGKIISGKIGGAGELGHVTIVPNGLLCGCGQRGCFEAYASATGIEREAESRLRVNKKTSLYEIYTKRPIEAKDVFDAAKAGDAMAIDIVDDEANYLALGLSYVLNILDPDVIVVGGGVALAGDFLFDKVKEKLKAYTLPPILENLKIKQAKLGNDAGIYGAVYLAMTEEKK